MTSAITSFLRLHTCLAMRLRLGNRVELASVPDLEKSEAPSNSHRIFGEYGEETGSPYLTIMLNGAHDGQGDGENYGHLPGIIVHAWEFIGVGDGSRFIQGSDN